MTRSRKLMIMAWIAALLLALCALLGGAFPAEEKADESFGISVDLASDETAKLELISGGKSGYLIVYSNDSNQQDNILADELIQHFVARGVVTVRSKSDSLQSTPVAKEILLGSTNRTESSELNAAMEARLKNSDDVAWGYAVIGEKVVFNATTEAAFKYAAVNFLEYLEANDFGLPTDLFDITVMTAEDFQAAVDERSEAERLGMIDELIALNGKFTDAQFNVDTYTPGQLYKPMAGEGGYFPTGAPDGKPWMYPTEGSHPRYLINEGNVDRIAEMLLEGKEEGSLYSALATNFWMLADTNMNDINLGAFRDAYVDGGSGKPYRYDERTLAVIEAKALAYLITGNELYAYEAIVGIKNAMLTLHFTADLHGDVYHGPSHVMIVTAAVYDWCYDVLSETDKWQLIWGTAQILGPQMEAGMRYPPSGGGTVNGHGTGPQVLRDWMSVSSAFYDEAPDWWDFVAGRYFNGYLPVANLQFQNGWVSQGTACYAPIKIYVQAWAAYIVKSATGENFLTEDAGKTMYYLISHIMPDYEDVYDGQTYFSTGDYSGRPHGTLIGFAEYFLIAGLYNDPVIYAQALDATRNHSIYDNSYLFTMTPTLQLCFSSAVDYNGEGSRDGVGTIQYFADPAGLMVARESWDDPESVAVFMNVLNLTMQNHEGTPHGTFQIYYKGLLAGSSGSYNTYGSAAHYYYHQSTVSQNGLLIHNPAFASSSSYAHPKNYYYSGSQDLFRQISDASAEAWVASARMADTVGAAYGYDEDGNAKFAYIAGDLTQAYSAETVEYVARHMLTVFTGDEDFPAYFITYDKITADDANFRKSWLLHTYVDPVIDQDNLTAVSVHGDGKLLVKSVSGADAIMKVGGEGKAWWIDGYFADPTDKGSWDAKTQSFTDPSSKGSWVEGKNAPDPDCETDGWQSIWGRIELRAEGEKRTNFLTLMAITDATNEKDVEYTKFSGENVEGLQIDNSVIVFTSTDSRYGKEISFETSGRGLYDYYIAGIETGTWQVLVDGVTVAHSVSTEEGGMLSFLAPAGKVTLKPGADVIGGNGGRIQYSTGGALLPKDAPYTYNNETPTPLPSKLEKDPDVFLGWYTSPNFEPETKITEIPQGATGLYKLYAKWARNYLTEDYSKTVIDLQNSLKVINRITYQTEGKSGASFKTKYDEDNDRNYLEWICGENDPLFSYSNESTNFATAMDDEGKCVSFTFSFMREPGKAPIAMDCRMIAKKDVKGNSISSTATYLYWIDQKGTVFTTDGGVLCTLSETEVTEIRVVVDFKRGEMRYYDQDYSLIETDTWSAPHTTGAANTEEFLKCLTQYLWYIRGTTAKDYPDAALRFYGVRVQESDEFYGNEKPQTEGIKYNTDGVDLPEDAPKKFHKDGLPTLLPTDIERPGFVFDGWYTTPTFDDGTKTAYAPAGATGLYEVWAKWNTLFLDEDWSNREIDHTAENKTVGGINYYGSGKEGSAYKTEEENGRKYLVWTKGSADPAITYINESTNVSTMTDSSVSYTVTLGKNGNAALPNIEFRLIGKKSVTGGSANSNIYLALLVDGALRLGDTETVIATVDSAEPVTVRIVVDFKSGTLAAYDESGAVIATTPLSDPPSATGAESFLEWRKCFANYVFYSRMFGGDAASSVRFFEMRAEEGNAFKKAETDLSDLTYVKYETNGGKLSKEATFKYDPAADTPLSTPEKKGYVFGGWYTTPTFDDGTLTTCVPAGTAGFYEVWAKWIDDTLKYETNGGTLPEDAPTAYDPWHGTLLPVNVTKNGYLFAGWYLTDDFSGEHVDYIPIGTSVAQKVYARWLYVPLEENWDESDILISDKVNETHDGMYYSTKTGTGFETVEDPNGGKYLRFHSAWNDVFLASSNDGSYQFPEFKETAVSFMFDYGRDGDLPLATNYLALQTTNGAQGVKWFITIDGATGEAKFDDTGEVIATIGEEMVTFRITVDFAAATVTAYDENHDVIASAPLGTPPKKAGVSSWAEWQKVAKGYYLYHQLYRPTGFTKGDGKVFGARYDNFVAIDGRAFVKFETELP